MKTIASLTVFASLDESKNFNFETCIVKAKESCISYKATYVKELGETITYTFSDGSVIRACEPSTEALLADESLPQNWVKYCSNNKFSRGTRSAIAGAPLFGYNIFKIYA